MIYIHKDEQQLGPFDESQITKAIQEGQFTYEDLAWKDGLAEWVRLGDLLPKEKTTPETPPPIPIPSLSETPTVIQTNVKQGAVIGGWVCFALGLATMFFSLWAFFIYAPLFLVAFILSIVAMAQKRVAGGIALLLATIILPTVVGLYLFTLRTTQAVANVLGVEHSTPSKPKNPKNEELDKKNGFRNFTLGMNFSEVSNLVEIDDNFIDKIFKSKDDNSKRYRIKDKSDNIGDAEIKNIYLTINQGILTKITVYVYGKQNVLILKESLIKAYGKPFAESNKIISWYGENNQLDLIIDDNGDYANAEYTNKHVDKKVEELISINKKAEEEQNKARERDMINKAKENADQGANSL
jgi:hypothetical protein